MTHPAITLVDVSARDGLQNEPQGKYLSAETKLTFLRMLAQTGLTRIEAGSFVRPQAVPAMANSREVAAAIAPIEADFPQVIFSYLVPNLKGLEAAISINAREVAIFLALSEQFSKANINATVEESFTAIAPVVQAARAAGMRVRGYLSNVFGYSDFAFTPSAVVRRSQQLLAMGCFEVSLGDTTAIGTPEMVEQLMAEISAQNLPLAQIAMHFHDTNGRAIANVARAYALGIRVFDAAAGGLGGCPYANSPKGNLAMEDVVNWCATNAVSCAITDTDALARATRFIRQALADATPTA